ncbi:ATP-binding cassette domain-containing protein [Kribbella sp. NBC_01245]|uniref:ABC transporter ATP-binding protein n=1 Tax=Kribbella sp. NBC_01245 TaxID=2903578 RepID=UPI002E2BD867|nr:ATP-binding cassette domain-containing protein [Kribbella sp. NBC_01245]
MISVRNLTVRYDAVVAVAEVSLDLPAGVFLAVSGPSGAGKSSLLWAIAGATAPTSGTVELDGTPVTSRPEAAASGVVLIPQGNGLARVLTARENLAIPLLSAPELGQVLRRARGDADEEDREEREESLRQVDGIVDQALTDVGLEDSGNHLVEELSGGEQQRVAVARGLAQRGRVILADESTSELDGANRERVLTLLRREAHRGAAVLIATHDPTVADAADAHASMDEGHLTWQRRL